MQIRIRRVNKRVAAILLLGLVMVVTLILRRPRDFDALSVGESLTGTAQNGVRIRSSYTDELLMLRDKFNDIPFGERIIRLGELARSAEFLNPTDPYKIEVLDILIDKLMSPDTDPAIKIYIPTAVIRFNYLSVEISSQSKRKLEGLLDKHLSQFTESDVELLASFEISGSEQILRAILTPKFGFDDSSNKVAYQYSGGITGITEVEWAALLANGRTGDTGAIEQIISVIENSDLDSRVPLIVRLGTIRSDRVVDYLAYYAFSDEEVTVRYDVPDSKAPIAWYAVMSMANQFSDFPISKGDQSLSDQERQEQIELVREWIELSGIMAH